MTIENILQLSPTEQIKVLKSKAPAVGFDVQKLKNNLNPSGHKVFDQTYRPNKTVKTDNGTRQEEVARIGLSLQKTIIDKAVSFLFGNPVEISAATQNPTQDEALRQIKRTLLDVKINSHNRRVARALFGECSVAELWFPQESNQGSHKLRVKLLSPLLGDELYPYFDHYGDMIAFSRAYALVNTQQKKESFFEVYTNHLILKYNTTSGEPVLMEGYPMVNVLGKIPVVYAYQEQTEYADVQGLIERLEKLLSNFADTNDYHGSPKIFVKGTLKGFSQKGESGTIIQGDAASDAQYLTWSSAPESVKLEIDTLLRMIYSLSQTPDISFESVKGLAGTTSGKALRLLFLDAHLKVAQHMEVFDEYLQRRMNIIKAYQGIFNPQFKAALNELWIEHEVVPFMIDDYADKLEFVMTATGNKPVLSQRTAIKMAGLVDDPQSEYQFLQEEELQPITEPTL